MLRKPVPPEHELLFKEYLGIHGWWNHAGGWSFYNIAKDPLLQGECVEIGSFKGCSTMFTALGAKQVGGKVWAVDPHPQWVADEFNHGVRTEAEFRENIKRFEFEDTIIPIVKPSEEALKEWSKPIRFLFIDGEHTYKAVLIDQRWLRHVVPGGLVFFDDCGVGSEVDRAMREVIYRDAEYSCCEGVFIRSGNEWWLNEN